MPQIFLHIDMDAFFAAIEQMDHPEFRNKPVVVGADPKKGLGRGVVSTCSYEARKYGIHSAMPISQAYKRCPHAVYVFPRGKRYSQVSKQVMSILYDFSPDIEQISIDEAFLDITSTSKLFGSAGILAMMMKQRILDEVNLTASVGIAPVKFIAKIASDLEKPNGLVEVKPEDVKDFLHPLDISRLWGVGPKTLPLLNKIGIKTFGDLAQFSQKEIFQRFGKFGLHFWNLANGIDTRKVETEHAAKSISKEITFFQDIESDIEIENKLLYLCNELSHEMRQKNYHGRTITLKIRLDDFTTFSRSLTVPASINSSENMFRIIKKLYKNFARSKKVRLLGVHVSHLNMGEGQLDLFQEQSAGKTKIDDVIDHVRKKFGENSITRASIMSHKDESQWIKE